jgi:hypothetical protein
MLQDCNIRAQRCNQWKSSRADRIGRRHPHDIAQGRIERTQPLHTVFLGRISKQN